MIREIYERSLLCHILTDWTHGNRIGEMEGAAISEWDLNMRGREGSGGR